MKLNSKFADFLRWLILPFIGVGYAVIVLVAVLGAFLYLPFQAVYMMLLGDFHPDEEEAENVVGIRERL
jgi:hypothetical protein